MSCNRVKYDTPRDFKITSECWDEERGVASGCQPKDVKNLGYGQKHGECPHLLIDIPERQSTIILRTSDGKLISLMVNQGDGSRIGVAQIRLPDQTEVFPFDSKPV